MTVETAKKMGFQAETKQLLHLMVHSLYSNKEIFIRELISNASDAADKLKFAALSDSDLFENDPELKIWISIDKDAGTLTIKDNGIGMTRDEVIKNLGTIAKSGTADFLKTLTGDRIKDSRLIGQFGVGFYSSFIVADKVTVRTRKAGEKADQAVMWSSDGHGEFEVDNITKPERGTEIVLHMKEEEKDFLNDYQLKHIITKYSDHITLPVLLGEESVNRATALWATPKQEITDEQYHEFYKHIAHDFDEPLTWTHNKVEGKLEYTSLLYIPKRAPFDLWQAGKPRGLKLYVQRVFIMDDSEQFLPHYLRFLRGIVDSNDLPLNVSREILQSSRVVDNIKSALVKRALGMLEHLSKDAEKYAIFWKEFGQVLKEGPAEDFANKEQIAKLFRFSSTHTDTSEQNVSLDDYISRMLDKQDKVYYVAAETFNAAKNSPHIEIFRKKGIEVLLLTDKVDEWLMAHLTEYAGKQLQSVAKGGLELGELDDQEDQKQQEQQTEDYKAIIEKISAVLGEKVKEVRLTRRLTSSPACIVADENDMTPQMQRLMQAAGQQVPTAKPIFELNPEHMLISKLKSESDEQRFKNLTEILFDQAVLAEGGHLDDPATFVKRFNDLLLELSSYS